MEYVPMSWKKKKKLYNIIDFNFLNIKKSYIIGRSNLVIENKTWVEHMMPTKVYEFASFICLAGS